MYTEQHCVHLRAHNLIIPMLDDAQQFAGCMGNSHKAYWVRCTPPANIVVGIL